MREAGFVSSPCGPDGPDAWALAEQLNERWDAVRRGEVMAPVLAEASLLIRTPGKKKKLTPEQADDLVPYKRGSVGWGFMRLRATSAWTSDKAERTHEDWWRGWRYIQPVFGQVAPSTITPSEMCEFRDTMLQEHGLSETHRTIKFWRALWKQNALYHLCHKDLDPSLAFENHASPKGRDQRWLEAQAMALSDKAWELGYYGLSAVICVLWDSQMSPVDVRMLRASQLASPDGTANDVFFTERKKTDKPVGGMLRAPSAVRLGEYLEKLDRVLAPDDFIFRHRSGEPYTKDKLGDDFRTVRAALYGAAEERTMADFRRSGAVEAIAGSVQPAHLSHTMGNSLDRCHKLFKTYCPVNVVSLRAVREAREAGSAKLAAEAKPPASPSGARAEQKKAKAASKSGRESERSGHLSPNASSKNR
jgi:hypothetical protein